MKNRSSYPTRQIIVAGCALALSSLAQPAQAYYGFNNWSYLPYTLGSTLLYPLRYAFRIPYQMGNPYYMTQYAVQGARLGMRAPGYGQNPIATDPYTDPEPINDPRQRQRPYRVGQPPEELNSYANWQKQPSPDDIDPAIDPRTGNLVPAAVPPTAPQRGANLPPSPMPPTSPTPPAPVPLAQGPAPLAAGFIKSVNEKYDGDISKALFNSETRSWARMIGFADNNDIFNADLTNDRIEVIRKIFRDPGLDPVSKLDAAKILLRNGSGTTPAPKISKK